MKKKDDRADRLIKLFTDRVRFWQEHLGLLSWCIDVLPQMKDTSEASTYVNNTEAGVSNRRVTVAYSLGFIHDEKTTDEMVDKAAFHEVCEVLLVPLRTMAQRAAGDHLVDNEVHAVIRVLENRLFRPLL